MYMHAPTHIFEIDTKKSGMRKYRCYKQSSFLVHRKHARKSVLEQRVGRPDDVCIRLEFYWWAAAAEKTLSPSSVTTTVYIALPDFDFA